jgi:hypothetical protein
MVENTSTQQKTKAMDLTKADRLSHERMCKNPYGITAAVMANNM